MKTLVGSLLLAWAVTASTLHAWDYEGHRLVNGLAVAGLPTEFPAFVRTPANAGRIAFLAGEPDRWKNNPDLSLRHENDPDHYLDLEQLAWAGLDLTTLSPLRNEFAVQFAAGRAAHPERFPAIDPEKNADHTREWPGFLPWSITEGFGKLKSAFSYLNAYQKYGGTTEEIANAEANIVYVMGVMGHFVADGAQPLHDTVHHNGWVGENPRGFTTTPQFHAWIDGGFMAKAGLVYANLAPRARAAHVLDLAPKPGERDALFATALAYLRAQNGRVVPLYEIEKAGQLKADGTPGSTDGRAFIEEQMLRGGEMLSSLWLTAWRTAPVDTYLMKQLQLRATAAPSPASAK
jgi:hypothetical protein